MTAVLAEQLRQARVYDLEQPRSFGMPIHPAHKPGYFYALHRRHRDGHDPAKHGPRTGASGTLVRWSTAAPTSSCDFLDPRIP